MSRILLLASLSLVLGQAWAGTVVEASFSSDLLLRYSSRGEVVNYTVYLPDSYSESDASFPVIYLLHGSGGSELDWLNQGDIAATADALIAAGALPPALLVMPSDYLVRYTPSPVRPEVFVSVLADELTAHIDSSYRTLPEPEFRAVAGVSFGGYMAVYLALSRPEVFRWGASLGGPFWTTDLPTSFKRTSLLAFFFVRAEAAARYSVYNHLDTRSGGVLLSVGDEDAFLYDNVALYRALTEAGSETELRITDGMHSWLTWQAAAPEVLRVFGHWFRQALPP